MLKEKQLSGEMLLKRLDLYAQVNGTIVEHYYDQLCWTEKNVEEIRAKDIIDVKTLLEIESKTQIHLPFLFHEENILLGAILGQKYDKDILKWLADSHTVSLVSSLYKEWLRSRR